MKTIRKRLLSPLVALIAAALLICASGGTALANTSGTAYPFSRGMNMACSFKLTVGTDYTTPIIAMGEGYTCDAYGHVGLDGHPSPRMEMYWVDNNYPYPVSPIYRLASSNLRSNTRIQVTSCIRYHVYTVDFYAFDEGGNSYLMAYTARVVCGSSVNV